MQGTTPSSNYPQVNSHQSNNAQPVDTQDPPFCDFLVAVLEHVKQFPNNPKESLSGIWNAISKLSTYHKFMVGGCALIVVSVPLMFNPVTAMAGLVVMFAGLGMCFIGTGIGIYQHYQKNNS